MERFESFIGVDFFTALFVLLNTLIIFLVAKKYLTGPIMGLIEKRQKEVDDAYARAKQAEDEAGALREEYTARLAEAKQTGDRLVREALDQAHQREEEIVSQAKTESAAILEKAYRDIELEKKKARNELKGEISDMAVSLAEKVTEKEIDAADHARLIDGFISSLENDK
jgi:F-type H+-transporting ATPase subunit b